MELNTFPIKEISTCAILVPLGFAAYTLKTGDLKIRLFFLFLLVGACVDGMGWFIYSNELENLYTFHGVFQYCYLFFEALFFVWLCTGFLNHPKVERIRISFFTLLTIAFLIKGVLFFAHLDDPYRPSPLNSLMDGMFLASISFLSAFALLQMAERISQLLTYPWFWIISGIFFYCFGSFFIDIMLAVGIMEEIWGMKNVVNIIQYGFFTTGLYLYEGNSFYQGANSRIQKES
ncbi:hypothetical protein SAMN04489724_0643 [Algoriphagus locisalis]|uniref:YhhN-like protein n=1 Tax=Algoriphagus locisalis TaxID=305507 RepID=A0A1I6XT74_9BACT|nr:hypothetical protein [Algoriphagus locisalis]SFT41236.1 hypothetical protein SAMN04489724_0643 [Algoriphagus locisalis]